MATFNSDQFTNFNAVPRVENDPNAGWSVKERVAWFTFTTPAGMAINDLINLVSLPDKARILVSRVENGAMGVGATLDIGITATPAKYLSALAVAAAGDADFANSAALNFGDVIAGVTTIQARASGAAWAAGIALKGYVRYLLE